MNPTHRLTLSVAQKDEFGQEILAAREFGFAGSGRVRCQQSPTPTMSNRPTLPARAVNERMQGYSLRRTKRKQVIDSSRKIIYALNLNSCFKIFSFITIYLKYCFCTF